MEYNSSVLPLYQCHKKVHAAKIASIFKHSDNSVEIGFEGGFDNIVLHPPFFERHQPEVGGYIVFYADGYKSFSPAAAFDEGYTLVEEGQITAPEGETGAAGNTAGSSENDGNSGAGSGTTEA